MTQRLLRLSALPPLTALSAGGGQDTAAILAMLLEDPKFRARHAPGDLVVIMSATGDEYRETDAYVTRMAALCAARDVPFLHVTPDLGYHTAAWQTLHGQWERNTTIQSVAFRRRSCSANLKLAPFYKALNAFVARRYGYVERVSNQHKAALHAYERDYGPLPVLIGFSKGEEVRVKEAPAGFMRTVIRRTYPLMEEGLDRRGAQEVTAQLGHEVPMPSNCRSCPFASPLDLLRLHHLDPQAFDTWAGFEARKLAAPKWQGTRNHTVLGNDLTLLQNLDRAEARYGHLGLEELDEIRFCRGHANTTSF